MQGAGHYTGFGTVKDIADAKVTELKLSTIISALYYGQSNGDCNITRL